MKQYKTKKNRCILHFFSWHSLVPKIPQKSLKVIHDPTNNNTSHFHGALQLTKYLHAVFHWLLKSSIKHHHSCPTDERGEAQRGWMTGLGSHKENAGTQHQTFWLWRFLFVCFSPWLSSVASRYTMQKISWHVYFNVSYWFKKAALGVLRIRDWPLLLVNRVTLGRSPLSAKWRTWIKDSRGSPNSERVLIRTYNWLEYSVRLLGLYYTLYFSTCSAAQQFQALWAMQSCSNSALKWELVKLFIRMLFGKLSPSLSWYHVSH